MTREINIMTTSYKTTAEDIDTAEINSQTTRKEDNDNVAHKNETTTTNAYTNPAATTITPTPSTTTTTTTIRTLDCCVVSEANETTTDDSHLAVQPIETKTKVGDITIIYAETTAKNGSIVTTHKACTINGSHNKYFTEDEEGTLKTGRASLMNKSSIVIGETSTKGDDIATAKDNYNVENIRWDFYFSRGNEAKEHITRGTVRWDNAPTDESRTMTLEIEKITQFEESKTDTLLCSILPDHLVTTESFMKGQDFCTKQGVLTSNSHTWTLNAGDKSTADASAMEKNTMTEGGNSGITEEFDKKKQDSRSSEHDCVSNNEIRSPEYDCTSDSDDSWTDAENGSQRTGRTSSSHDSILEISRYSTERKENKTQPNNAGNKTRQVTQITNTGSENQTAADDPFHEIQNVIKNTGTITSDVHVSHQGVTTARNVGIFMNRKDILSPEPQILMTREIYNRSNQFRSASTAWNDETSQLGDYDVGVDDYASKEQVYTRSKEEAYTRSNEELYTRNTEQFITRRKDNTNWIDESTTDGRITGEKSIENSQLGNEINAEVNKNTSKRIDNTTSYYSSMSLPAVEIGQNVSFIATSPVDRETATQSLAVENVTFEQVNVPATYVTNETTTSVNFVLALASQTAIMAAALSTMAASFNTMSTQLQTNTATNPCPIALSSIVAIINQTVTGATSVNTISEDLIVMVDNTSTHQQWRLTYQPECSSNTGCR